MLKRKTNGGEEGQVKRRRQEDEDDEDEAMDVEMGNERVRFCGVCVCVYVCVCLCVCARPCVPTLMYACRGACMCVCDCVGEMFIPFPETFWFQFVACFQFVKMMFCGVEAIQVKHNDTTLSESCVVKRNHCYFTACQKINLGM